MNYYISIAGSFKSKEYSKEEAEKIVFRSFCEGKTVNSVTNGEDVFLTIGKDEEQ